jgi:hypothetical protein
VKVEVLWPSGHRDSFSNVKANQSITIREAQRAIFASHASD